VPATWQRSPLFQVLDEFTTGLPWGGKKLRGDERHPSIEIAVSVHFQDFFFPFFLAAFFFFGMTLTSLRCGVQDRT
jgi:hypothetical protein